MVMILCRKIGQFSRATINGVLRLPHPYDLGSFKGVFPSDVTVTSTTKPYDFMDLGSFMFISDKAKKILESFCTNVEFFPVVLKYRKKTVPGWHYLHFLEEVDCLDHEKTVRAGPDVSQPEMIKYMALRQHTCENKTIFRIGDSTAIAVSDELASAI